MGRGVFITDEEIHVQLLRTMVLCADFIQRLALPRQRQRWLVESPGLSPTT